MKFNLYKDVKLMYQDTYNILVKNEVLNAILLGNLVIGCKEIETSGWKNTINWFMATISDNQEIKLIALMTPPHNLTLYEVQENDECISFLIDNLIVNNITIPGVMAEKVLAEKFAKEYTKKTNLKYELIKNQGIYELEKVNNDIKQIGVLRPFKECDLSFVPYWIEAARSHFNNVPINEVNENINYYSQIMGLYILEVEGIGVSMAKISREMTTCSCVGMVYTPPYFRNNGYATSCVAKISQKILDNGFKKCVLYTDLDYPISNSIYKKIGYVHVYNSSEIRFLNK